MLITKIIATVAVNTHHFLHDSKIPEFNLKRLKRLHWLELGNRPHWLDMPKKIMKNRDCVVWILFLNRRKYNNRKYPKIIHNKTIN